MLITISGMVGSGKSTTASRLVAILGDAGYPSRYLRFRHLGIFGARRQPNAGAAEPGVHTAGPSRRGSGFGRRRLTAVLALGYAARIMAFRLSGVGGANRCDVLDRYFYDSLIHYQLTSPFERLCAALIQRLIPTPDAAILLLASEETLVSRRPNYERDYVVEASRRYRDLTRLFPHLIPIRTDTGDPDEQLRQVVRRVIDRE